MTVRVLVGDVREKLAELPAESVHCVVTSPPYFGLRDYGTASWEGGDPECGHIARMARGDAGRCSDDTRPGVNPEPVATPMQFRSICGKCGATRTDKQIGLEATPAEYVAVMVEVFREVRRVMRPDATLWLNLGDSYAGSWGAQGKKPDGGISDGQIAHHPQIASGTGSMQRFRAGNPDKNGGNSNRDGVGPVVGLKPKDLIGIPWRVAFALQADGWYLRQDIIWAKPNPMPESVTDRCTKAHEYLFLLSKSARYHYDAEAIAEPAAYPDDGVRVATPKNAALGLIATTQYGEMSNNGTRNRRSVWTVATQPFSEAHFATFPPDLIEPCIKAGCPKGGTVLDPFGGAGTTGLVADRLQRDAILIELNPAYADLATNRIIDDGPLFAVVAA